MLDEDLWLLQRREMPSALALLEALDGTRPRRVALIGDEELAREGRDGEVREEVLGVGEVGRKIRVEGVGEEGGADRSSCGKEGQDGIFFKGETGRTEPVDRESKVERVAVERWVWLLTRTLNRR